MVLEYQHTMAQVTKTRTPLNKFIDRIMPFSIGASSGVISLIATQPFDTLKVISQVKSEHFGKNEKPHPLKILRSSYSGKQLIRQLYKGLDSAVIRQLTYTGTRMGVYKSLYNRYNTRNGRVPLEMKTFFGLVAGFFGALVGNPADLILTRMQSDMFLPEEQKRNYKNFFHAFFRIIKDEGFLSLFRGSGPTVARAMILNGTQLSSFDHFKEMLNKFSEKKDTLTIRVGASAVAGFFAAITSLPFDNLKTKMQKMVKQSDGQFKYSGISDAMRQTVKNEGFMRLWTGFVPFYARLAPRTMIILVLQDFLTDAWNKTKHH